MENSKSRITNIKLKNFRRFSFINLKIEKNVVVIYGPNAVGKTTILEAIYLAGITKSHKTNKDVDLIKKDNEFAIIDINYKNENKIIISNSGKKTYINGIEIKKLSDYIGNLYVILFSPEDLNLIKGSPADRRRFINIEIGQVDKIYLSELVKYNKILKQRNEMLKANEINQIMLDVITNELINSGNKIINYRNNFINEIKKLAGEINFSISKEHLNIEYNSKELTKQMYDEKLKSDIYNKITQIGPHRDDISFYINGSKSELCSQGQQRTICLSLKLALIEYIKNKTGENPILLLDDVLSELDDNRQIKLIENIMKCKQSFITTTNINTIKKYITDCQLIEINKEGVL